MEKEFEDLIIKVKEAISDRNSCMTKLALSQIPLMNWLATAGINSGNDVNGQKEKYIMVKEQLERIDRTILALK